MINENEARLKETSFMITCPREEADEIISGLKSEAEEKDEMIMVVDGATVEPQKNIAENAIRLAERFKNMPEWGWREAIKAVEAGLYVAIMRSTVEALEGLAEEKGYDYDSSRPKYIIQKVANYGWEDSDKIDGAATALSGKDRTAEVLGVKRITLVIKNFDLIQHPIDGPKFNNKLAESFLCFRGERSRVILFREGNNQI